MALIEKIELDSFLATSADLVSLLRTDVNLSSLPIDQIDVDSDLKTSVNLESGIYLEEISV
jgi:hypothetical protein